MANNPHAPSPWASGPSAEKKYGIYTPDYARIAYRKLISEVRSQEMDEGHAVETYSKLERLANDVGETEAAETFRTIANQEAKHQSDLRFIIDALETQLEEV